MSVNLVGTTALDSAIEAAASHLLSRQREEGCWWGKLRTNVTMEAEYVLLAHCLDRRNPDREEKIRRYLLDLQEEDGSWPVYPGGGGDLNVTVEAYQALKLIGMEQADPRMQRAREFIVGCGGVERTRVFTRLWLALIGEYDWRKLPVVPPEMILLPTFMPVNIYDFACWARQTVVPLSIVMAHRPVFPIPASARIPELFVPGVAAGKKPGSGWERFFAVGDRVLRAYQELDIHPGRDIAERRAIEWIIERQEKDGSWGGIQPPWFYSLLALKTLGMTEHPAFLRGWDGLETFGVEEDGRWWFQACVSPVWDTALSVQALRAAGLSPSHPALVRAADWLCSQQVFSLGDWRYRRPKTEPGGWAFELANERYPDVDDTAIVLEALNQVRLPDENRRKTALTAGFRWMVAMQCKNGGWAAFDADNTRSWAAQIPFSDFGWVVDPPTEDVTGHVLESFGIFGYDEAWSVIQRGIRFLRKTQQPDGSWMGRWGVNYIYGTGAVLPGLAAVGQDMREPWVARALDFLTGAQNEDGGWGESCASYEDDSWRGRGDSTPSQTAWALLGLIAGGMAGSEAVRRGVSYLQSIQRDDGGWDESLYTGTGFPKDFFIGYEMYRDVFPLLALGRYRTAQAK